MLLLAVQREPGHAIAKQIYEQVRSMILSGELRAGERLPSTRELSCGLNVSRNTVLTAYDMLTAEGYTAGIPGSGMFVRSGAQLRKEPETIVDCRATAFSGPLPEGMVSFDSGTPALELFPRGKWNRLAAQAFLDAPVSALGYDDPQGRPELRRALTAYLKKTRGICCHPDQILITAGAKQGLSLVAKCLLGADSEVFLEDPSNGNVKRIFSYHTRNIMPIAVDSEGIQPALLPSGRKPALLFVTPSHQFPMGGILSIQRRLELIRYADQTGCYIVEDDYDSEFQYSGLPVHSLYALESKRTIYLGTFSKILFPSLRLGYLVLLWPLVEQCREWKRLNDHHSNSLYQLALLHFLESGELERHILRMKRVYRKRRDTLIALLQAYFPNQISVLGEAAGMHVVARFLGVEFSPALMERIRKAGVNIIPVEDHAIVKGSHRGEAILGYAHLSPEEMEQGLNRLKTVLLENVMQ